MAAADEVRHMSSLPTSKSAHLHHEVRTVQIASTKHADSRIFAYMWTASRTITAVSE